MHDPIKPPDSLVIQNNNVLYYFQIRNLLKKVKVDLIEFDLITKKMKVVKEFDHFEKLPFYIAFCR